MEASPSVTVRRQLGRLARGRARVVGGARAGRWHLAILVVACVVAFVHRSVAEIPGLEAVRGSWPLLLATAGGLYVLGILLRLVFTFGIRDSEEALARELDDRYGWHDETDTAATLPERDTNGPHGLGGLVAVQAGGRLRELDARSLGRAARPWGRLRLVLVLLFVAILILPGVGGVFGRTGAGTKGGDGLGSAGLDEDFGEPGPMKADFWFQAFVENPIPVEPLPVEPLPSEAKPEEGK